jgi:glycosyltransferase involved in cell wall biosynthesis
MYTRSYPFLKKLPVILTERLINTCSTMTIAISDAQKKTLMDYKVAKSEKVAVIHLGFDFSKILPVSDWKDSLKIKYGLPANSLIVSIIGRVTPVKNHPFFIKIAERLIPLHENLFFLVIGDGDDFDSVYQIVKEKRLDERIHFTGMIRDMREAYTITDALVLTSDSEGTPVVLIEAMASRKVVFSTNVGGVSDFIVNGRNGFYYEQGDINGFVTEISNWVSNPQDYIPIQEEAHRTAMAKFSSERLISDVDQLYQKLLIDKGLL